MLEKWPAGIKYQKSAPQAQNVRKWPPGVRIYGETAPQGLDRPVGITWGEQRVRFALENSDVLLLGGQIKHLCIPTHVSQESEMLVRKSG